MDPRLEPLIALAQNLLGKYKDLANNVIVLLPPTQANELGVEAVEVLTEAHTELNRIAGMRNIG